MGECFSDGSFAMKDLIKDEQRKIFDCMIAAAAATLDLQVRRMFARIIPLVESMRNLGITPPPRFATLADEHFHVQLLDEFHRHPVRFNNVRSVLETAKRRNIKWREDALEPEIRSTIELLAYEARQSPADITAWRNLIAAVSAAKYLPFAVNFYETQNHCYALLREHYSEIITDAEKGHADAMKLKKILRMLGSLLSINIRSGNTP